MGDGRTGAEPGADGSDEDTWPVARCQLVLYLPFRAMPCGDDPARAPSDEEWADFHSQLAAHSDGRLKALAGRQRGRRPGADNKPDDAAAPLWRGVNPALAAKRYSGDFYGIASRILCDTGHFYESMAAPAASQRSQGDAAAAASAHGQWLRNASLQMLLQGRQLLRLSFEDAWLRLFGTGIGLLGLRLEVSGETGLQQAALLRAVHELVQPAQREGKSLLRPAGSWRLAATAPGATVAEGSLWTPGGGRGSQALQGLQPCDPASFREGGLPSKPVFRVVSPGVDGHTLLERVQVVPVRLPQPLAPGALLVAQEADDGPESSPCRLPARGEAHTHVLLSVADGGDAQHGWAGRLLQGASLLDWLLALLPDSPRHIGPFDGVAAQRSTDAADDSQAAPAAAPQHEQPLRDVLMRRRLYSYVGVQLDKPAAGEGLARAAFRLARRFDGQYRPEAAAVAQGSLRPFEPIVHSVATQGAASVVQVQGHDGFLGNFLNDVFLKTYLPLAEICLHEYALLVGLTQQSAYRLSYPAQEAGLEQLRSLSAALTNYRLCYRFTQISHMAHHNDVLALWRRGLGLDELESALSRDVHEAREFLEQDLERRRDAREAVEQDLERGRDRLLRLAGVFGVFLAASLGAADVQDRLAQPACPPDGLSVALADMQLHHGHAIPALGVFRAVPGMEHLASERLLGEVCRARQAPSTAAAGDFQALLMQRVDAGSASSITWASQLDGLCPTAARVELCMQEAGGLEPRQRWMPMIVGLVAALFALAILLGHVERAKQWCRRRFPRWLGPR